MTMLNKPELVALLNGSPPLIEGFDLSWLNRPDPTVRGSSLDLTIGEIFKPGAKGDELGGPKQPREKLPLKQGETAVIRTAEKLQLPNDVSGFGFPPSTDVSLAGLLTTNPGHIDPGYSGHLHLTVINMGSETFVLKKGDRVMRLLFFRLKTPVQPRAAGGPVITDELLSRLSEDFLDVTNRAAQAADRAVKAGQLWVPALALVTSVIAALFTAWAQTSHLNDDVSAKLSAMQTQLTRLEGQVNAGEGLAANQAVMDRLRKLEEKTSGAPEKGVSQPK